MIILDGTEVNVYIDDRGGLIQIYNELLTLIEKIENGDVKHE